MDKLLSSARVWGPGFITPTYDESGRNAANFRAQLYGIGKIVKRLSLIARLAALWLLPSLNQRPNQGSSRLPDCRHSSFNWVRIPYTLTYLSKLLQWTLSFNVTVSFNFFTLSSWFLWFLYEFFLSFLCWRVGLPCCQTSICLLLTCLSFLT